MYTIKEASQRTGVSVALLRAWERRYGIVEPTRTEARYRLYNDADITRVRAMRALVATGRSPRQAANHLSTLPAADVAKLAGDVPRIDGETVREPVRGRHLPFVRAAGRIDGAAIERALDEMFASGSFERVVEDWLYPCLVALGEAWERGEVDVAGEHAASAAALRRLGIAFEAAGQGAAGVAPILVGLPSGARHELPALAFATALRRAGMNATYLGPDVPVASWLTAVQRTRARAVVIGVGMADDVLPASAVVDAMQATTDLLLAVGGRHGTDVIHDSVIHLPDRLSDAVDVLSTELARG